MYTAGIDVSGRKITVSTLRSLVGVGAILLSGYMVAEINKFLCRHYDKV